MWISDTSGHGHGDNSGDNSGDKSGDNSGDIQVLDTFCRSVKKYLTCFVLM